MKKQRENLMRKYILLLLIWLSSQTKTLAENIQVFGVGFQYAAVELTNCVFPLIKSTNLVDWEQCGLVVPIPANPRAAWCYYRIGADWNTNVPIWLTQTNTYFVFQTNTLSQMPKVVNVTNTIIRYKTNTVTTTSSSKSGKLITTPVVYKSLPPLPQPQQ